MRLKKMNPLKQISRVLPLWRKTKVCEACGESFDCEVSLGKGCWCGEIRLSEKSRQELRAKYRDCLCRACLEKVAAMNSTSEVRLNAHD